MVSCFVAVMCQGNCTHELLIYTRLILDLARKHGGRGWLDYVWVFRQQIAANPAHSWATQTLSDGVPQSWGQATRITVVYGAHCARRQQTTEPLNVPSSLLSPRPALLAKPHLNPLKGSTDMTQSV